MDEAGDRRIKWRAAREPGKIVYSLDRRNCPARTFQLSEYFPMLLLSPVND